MELYKNIRIGGHAPTMRILLEQKSAFLCRQARKCAFLRRGESKGGVRGRISDASPSGACNRTSDASSAGWRPSFWPPSGRSVAQPQATNPFFAQITKKRPAGRWFIFCVALTARPSRSGSVRSRLPDTLPENPRLRGWSGRALPWPRGPLWPGRRSHPL